MDDSACCGSLLRIWKWLLWLLEHGPAYGYYAESSKSVLVIKEQHLQEAQDIFANLQVKVVLTSCFLGGCVGNTKGIRQYVVGKVNTWAKGVKQLPTW